MNSVLNKFLDIRADVDATDGENITESIEQPAWSKKELHTAETQSMFCTLNILANHKTYMNQIQGQKSNLRAV